MIRSWFDRFLSAISVLPCFVPFSSAQNPVYHDPSRPFVATVRVLAIGSGVHQSFAGSQDTYLVTYRTKRGEEHVAMLIDRYSEDDYSVRRSLLTAQQRLLMRLSRDESCDASMNNFHVSDDVTNVFTPALFSLVAEHGTETVLCFTIDHRATRIAE